jgi:hypothetical protein
MAEEKLNETVSVPPPATDYETPRVEEVVTRENLEREAAYAGAPLSRLA